MLTKEILDKVVSDATFARDIQSLIVDMHPEMVLAMVAEIRELRKASAELVPITAQASAYCSQYEVGETGEKILQAVVDDAERLRDELERRDTEIGALRSQLRSAQAVIKEGKRTPGDVDYAEYVESYERAMGAKPDAAPVENAAARVIAVGDTVRVKEATGMDGGLTGKVTVVGMYTVSIVTDEGRYFGYPKHAVERVQD